MAAVGGRSGGGTGGALGARLPRGGPGTDRDVPRRLFKPGPGSGLRYQQRFPECRRGRPLRLFIPDRTASGEPDRPQCAALPVELAAPGRSRLLVPGVLHQLRELAQRAGAGFHRAGHLDGDRLRLPRPDLLAIQIRTLRRGVKRLGNARNRRLPDPPQRAVRPDRRRAEGAWRGFRRQPSGPEQGGDLVRPAQRPADADRGNAQRTESY